MKILIFIFVSMTVYGLFTGYIGAALISLVMSLFVSYAHCKFKQQDRELDTAAAAKTVYKQ